MHEAHSDYLLTFRARCHELGCDFDSGEVNTQAELLLAVQAHHEMEVHTIDDIEQLLADHKPTEPT